MRLMGLFSPEPAHNDAAKLVLNRRRSGNQRRRTGGEPDILTEQGQLAALARNRTLASIRG